MASGLRPCIARRVPATLADHGLDRQHELWSGPRRAWLAEQKLPLVSWLIIDDHLALIDALGSAEHAAEEQPSRDAGSLSLMVAASGVQRHCLGCVGKVANGITTMHWPASLG